MSLVQNRKNSALRVAFLTDSSFQAANEAAKGALKKRALRVIERNVRYPVVENSNYPDAVFYIRRVAYGTGFILQLKKEKK